METYIEWDDGTSRQRFGFTPIDALQALASDIKEKPSTTIKVAWFMENGKMTMFFKPSGFKMKGIHNGYVPNTGQSEGSSRDI